MKGSYMRNNTLVSMFLFLSCLNYLVIAQAPVQPFQPTTFLEKDIQTSMERAEKFHDIPAVMLSLKLLSDAAKEKKETPPHYNLCNLSKPGTNLFCQGSKGIPRIKMPQVSGRPVPGSLASKKTPDKYGTVHGEDEFMDYLKKQGITISDAEIPAADLKATQNELVGAKVADIWWLLKDETNPEYQWALSPLFTSQDNYILDGHHRWAAIAANAAGSGNFLSKKIKVWKVNIPILDLVDKANKFANEFGILQEAG